jgi:hypothetical protein
MVAATARWLAAYAERHCGSYRATWWVHAGTEPGMRADLVDLGLRLGWVRRVRRLRIFGQRDKLKADRSKGA